MQAPPPVADGVRVVVVLQLQQHHRHEDGMGVVVAAAPSVPFSFAAACPLLMCASFIMMVMMVTPFVGHGAGHCCSIIGVIGVV